MTYNYSKELPLLHKECEELIAKISALSNKSDKDIREYAIERSKSSPLSYYGFLVYMLEQEQLKY